MHKLVVVTALAAAGLLVSPAAVRAEGDWGENARDESAEEVAPRAIDPKKDADIRKLIALTGEVELSKQAMSRMLVGFKEILPDVPGAFWDEFMAEVKDEELVDLLVPIYDRHLSHADLKALVAFYSSPAGRRVIEALPAISGEAMTAGEVWGQRLAMRVVRRAQERGFTVKPAKRPAE